MQLINEINAIISIAFRDGIKYVKNPTRLLFSAVFPIIFIGALGGSLDSNLSGTVGFNFISFVLTGVFAQTWFSTVASGVISLKQDYEKNLTQELFVAPISRVSIILGKIFGEMGTAFLQGVFIILFGLLLGVSFTFTQILLMTFAGVIVGIMGGAFGIFVMSFLGDTKFINSVFPLLLLPQYFLAGSFSPIQELPWYLWWLSRAIPLTYGVDFVRNLFYTGLPELELVTLFSTGFAFAVLGIYTLALVILGSTRFASQQKNR